MTTENGRATYVDLPQAPYRAIQTRFAGPTNTRGARIIADAGDRASRVVVGYDHGLNAEQNHAYAAVLVTRKMGWTPEPDNHFTPLVGGGLGDRYVWVFTPRAEAE